MGSKALLLPDDLIWVQKATFLDLEIQFRFTCVYRKPYPALSVNGIAYSAAMIVLFGFLLAVLVASFRSNSSLVGENVLLRHQVLVLRRKIKGRVPLTNGDRWFLVQLYRWFPSIVSCLVVIERRP
jgi:hypothetical protein